MIGFISRTISPSIEQSRRSTPCVAGWCGPRLTVKSSWSGASSICVSRLASVPYSGPSRAPVVSSVLLIPARHFVLVEGEQDRLAADREVAPLRMPHVVLRHQDAPHVGVSL